ncbi:MAG: YgeY family selenium metabolism-linked hydrolase [Bacillota bacterium]
MTTIKAFRGDLEMPDETVSAVKEYLGARREDLLSFLRRLIAIPSPTGSEGDVARRVAEEMKRLGYDEVFFDRIGNVVGRIGHGPIKVLFDAHMDTVGADQAGWTVDPYAGKIEGDTLFGLGSCDDKGSLSGMVYGAAALKAAGFPADRATVFVVGAVGEESCEGLGVGHLITREGVHPDFVVIGEASDLGVRRGHRGRTLLSVTYQGKPCHASVPQLGDNPLEKIVPLLSGVKPLNRRFRDDSFLGKGSAVVTSVEVNSASLNSVPATATVYIDRRMTVGETREGILDEIKSVLGGHEASVEVVKVDQPSYTGYPRSGEEFFPPWSLPEDHPLVRAGMETGRAVLGREPDLGRWDFSTDGTFTAGAAKIPTIGFGPGDGRWAHAPNEQVPVSQIITAAGFYALVPWVLSRSKG